MESQCHRYSWRLLPACRKQTFLLDFPSSLLQRQRPTHAYYYLVVAPRYDGEIIFPSDGGGGVDVAKNSFQLLSSFRTSTTCTSTSFVVAATKHPFLFGLFFTKVLRFYNTNKSSVRCIRDFSDDILQLFTIHHHLSHLLTRFFGRKTCRLWKRNTYLQYVCVSTFLYCVPSLPLILCFFCTMYFLKSCTGLDVSFNLMDLAALHHISK